MQLVRFRVVTVVNTFLKNKHIVVALLVDVLVAGLLHPGFEGLAGKGGYSATLDRRVISQIGAHFHDLLLA